MLKNWLISRSSAGLTKCPTFLFLVCIRIIEVVLLLLLLLLPGLLFRSSILSLFLGLLLAILVFIKKNLMDETINNKTTTNCRSGSCLMCYGEGRYKDTPLQKISHTIQYSNDPSGNYLCKRFIKASKWPHVTWRIKGKFFSTKLTISSFPLFVTVNAFARAGGGVMNIDLSPSPFRIKSNLKTDPLKIKTRIMIIYYYRMTKKSFFEKKSWS